MEIEARAPCEESRGYYTRFEIIEVNSSIKFCPSDLGINGGAFFATIVREIVELLKSKFWNIENILPSFRKNDDFVLFFSLFPRNFRQH